MFEKDIKGRKFQWCSKCNRWSTTHNSSTHTGKANGKNNPDAQANYSLVPDPSMWLAEACVPVPHNPHVNTFPENNPKTPKVKQTDSSNWFSPHLYCILGLYSVSALLNPSVLTWLSSSMFQRYIWFRAMTIGDVIDFSSLFLAPILWLALTYASLYGNQILHRIDPNTAKAAKMPSQPRKI